MTSLPPLDRGTADAFWQRYLDATGANAGDGYVDLACFGDSVELANELVELVLMGQKRATASSVDEFEHEGWPLPGVGDRWIACDGTGRPRAIIETSRSASARCRRSTTSSPGTKERATAAETTGYADTSPTSAAPTRPQISLSTRRYRSRSSASRSHTRSRTACRHLSSWSRRERHFCRYPLLCSGHGVGEAVD